MLDELQRVINRLGCSIPFSPRLTDTLVRQHEYFRRELERVDKAIDHPNVMRIFAEEVAYQAQYVLDDFRARESGGGEENAWKAYREAMRSGKILGLEYERYIGAGKLFRAFLHGSYLDETEGEDDKAKRYAYAVSKEPLPEWFVPDKVTGWLEEMITAACFLWFAVMDYAEECGPSAA